MVKVMLARGTKVQSQKVKNAFLAAYRKCGIRSVACRVSGVPCKHVSAWLHNDPQFKEDFAEAQQQATEVLEEEATRRAVDGTARLKFDKDGKALIDPRTGDYYEEHQYSDILLIFLLKGLNPKKYRDTAPAEEPGKTLVLTQEIVGPPA